jgi:cation transport protein ChaC
MRREMSMVPSAFPWRWIEVTTEAGRITALTFAMNRKSGRYVADLSQEQLVEVLATARGFRGSMAEYLFWTVSKLEELGIHDRNLWRLQALVAGRIDALHPIVPPPTG